jgi:hypothetical protein
MVKEGGSLFGSKKPNLMEKRLDTIEREQNKRLTDLEEKYKTVKSAYYKLEELVFANEKEIKGYIKDQMKNIDGALNTKQYEIEQHFNKELTELKNSLAPQMGGARLSKTRKRILVGPTKLFTKRKKP